MKKIAVIGSGFSGLSAAAYLAKEGYEVHVFEKHNKPGGRARQFSTEQGYVFDMGPSWYWMPDIMERFFTDFGYKTSDFFTLISLNPQFDIVFSNEKISIPKNLEELKILFEQTEKGAGIQLEKFMRSAKFKYEVGMKEFVNKPSHNWFEFASPEIIKNALKLDLLTNFRSYVSRYFKSEKLRTLMEFPVIFLGASPKNIPALYSLMNYGGYALGTYYPLGGFYQLVSAMKNIGEKQGAIFHFNKTVESINTENDRVKSLTINGENYEFDAVIASSDYHHTETLLKKDYRNYTETYWHNRTFAPSCLIFYLGINRTIPNLKHHTLFFENNLDEHIRSIFSLTSFNSGVLDEVRTNYNKFLSDKALCEKMISRLKKMKNNSAIHLGYLGSLQTINASQVFNPISKLNIFREGKKNIEQSIEKEPENVELRFIRLSVQKNAPSFLRYKSNIKEDTEFIRKNYHKIESAVLQENIKAVLND